MIKAQQAAAFPPPPSLHLRGASIFLVFFLGCGLRWSLLCLTRADAPCRIPPFCSPSALPLRDPGRLCETENPWPTLFGWPASILFQHHLSPYLTVVALSGLVLILTAGQTTAESVLTPAGLNPGDQYRVLFITEGIRDGTSFFYNDYNDFVNVEAVRAGSVLAVSTTFRAVVSHRDGDVINIISSFGPGVDLLPIFLVDGTMFATNTQDLFDGTFGTGVFRDQFNNPTPTLALYYTGSDTDGTRAGSPLGGLLGDPFPFTVIGGGDDFSHGLAATEASYPLLGISDALTVSPAPPVVPVPSAAVLFSVAVLGGLVRRRPRSPQF